MYLVDYIVHHLVILTNLFARLRLHKLKLSPKPPARVDVLGHVGFANGVPSNLNRVALGGLWCYGAFQSIMARIIRPYHLPYQRRRHVRFHLYNEDTVLALSTVDLRPPRLGLC